MLNGNESMKVGRVTNPFTNFQLQLCEIKPTKNNNPVGPGSYPFEINLVTST
jgi:hypothetical protein